MQILAVLIISVVTAACASSGAVPRPFPGATGPTGAEPVAPVAPDASAPSRFEPSALVQTALGFRGVPYRNGGSDPAGFDCSGFVQYVFAQHGLGLPRSVKEQFIFGDEVVTPNARAGDLIFFETDGSGPSHVGLVVEGDQFVHAPSSRGVVRVERFSGRYWSERLVGIKRLR